MAQKLCDRPPEVRIIFAPRGPEADAALRRYWATAWRLAERKVVELEAAEAAKQVETAGT